jgi:UDP-glucose:(heptosyl)LPS alpha-1,3-glucosyltransferase
MMNKRIAIIIERANIALGGAERSVFELAPALSSLGFKVDILAAKGLASAKRYGGAKETNAKNIYILCQDSPDKRVGLRRFEKKLKQHLSENRYSLVHSVLPFDFADIYQPRGGAYAESIVRNAASYQNKFFSSCKKLTAFANFRRTRLLRAERQLCKEPDGPVIIALSQYVAEQFKQHYAVSNNRIAVIPNGVKINEKIDKNQAERFRTQILTRLGLKEADSPILFLFAAHNFRLKGLSAAIKALKHKKAYLIVVGNDRTCKYIRLAKKRGVDKQVLFLGAVKHIQNILSIIDIAILPTFYDPCSRYILEALCADKPVITTRFNGAVDLFTNNRHGKVIDDAADIPALAEAIGYFSDTNNIQKASQAIIADNIKENISISRVAKQLESLYKSILGKKVLKQCT